jgi:hypothetical protein
MGEEGGGVTQRERLSREVLVWKAVSALTLIAFMCFTAYVIGSSTTQQQTTKEREPTVWSI